MTALSSNRSTKRMGDGAHPDVVNYPAADNVHLYRGGMAGVDASGNAVPASNATAVKITGIIDQECDNTISGHVAGGLNCRVRQGTFKWTNGATNDALTVADIGRPCYAHGDDITVDRTSANGTRLRAGTVIEVDSDGVWVDTLLEAPLSEEDGTLLLMPAEDNFAAAVNLGVKVFKHAADGTATIKTAGAGDFAIGVLQNKPAAGAIAKVRVRGITPAVASGVINVGEFCAADANGQFKKASVLAVSAAAANGSFATGIALTAGSANNSFQMLVLPMTGVPTNGV